MPENNNMMSVEGQLVGMPLAGPESFSQQQLNYLKHALGVDETVLYSVSGDGMTTSFTLSEPATNFEYLRFQGVGYNNGPCLVTIPAPTAKTENISVTYVYFCANNDSNPLQVHSCRFSTTDAQTYTTIDKKFLYWPLNGGTATGNNTSILSITKVIGIHRIAGGNQ